MNIIIAPHADDELIGCSTLLQWGKIDGIIYVKTTQKREVEARKLCKDIDVKCWFLCGDIWNLLNLLPEYTYYIPSPEDGHPLHSLVYYLMFHEYPNLIVYSTYMNDYFVREVEDPQYKLNLLNKYYPSQKSLWEFDHKYFLFEGHAKL